MSIKGIFLLILVSEVMSVCKEGCLVCNSDNECEFCDVSNSYTLVNSVCVKDSSDHCVLRFNDGFCEECQSDYYYDSS